MKARDFLNGLAVGVVVAALASTIIPRHGDPAGSGYPPWALTALALVSVATGTLVSRRAGMSAKVRHFAERHRTLARVARAVLNLFLALVVVDLVLSCVFVFVG
jgi:cytochrome b